jgi:hypothetical protein
MKKLSLVILVLVVAHSYAFAQKDETFWASIELGYGRTLADKGKYEFVNPNDKMYMANGNAKLRYYFTPQLACGAGIGITPYHNYEITTAYLYADLHYDFVRVPRLFANFNVGIPFWAETASSNFLVSMLSDYNVDYSSGLMTNVSIGYILLQGRYRSAYIALGYHLFRHTLSISPMGNIEDDAHTDKRLKHAILLRLGYEFNTQEMFVY